MAYLPPDPSPNWSACRALADAIPGAAEHGVTLDSHRRGYLLNTDPDTIDVHHFGRPLDADTNLRPGRTDRLLREAPAEWRSPALHHARSSMQEDRAVVEQRDAVLATQQARATARVQRERTHPVQQEWAVVALDPQPPQVAVRPVEA